jgi:hypothetical protein
MMIPMALGERNATALNEGCAEGVNMSPTTDKETLKALREERKETIALARRNIQENNKILKSIRAQIATEPKTVPEIARALSMHTDRVLLFVSALKKYGEVVEGPKEDDYFKYALIS